MARTLKTVDFFRICDLIPTTTQTMITKPLEAGDCFRAVNPEWTYAVELPTGQRIFFTPLESGNSKNTWMASHPGAPASFLLLSPAVVVKMLNQSLNAGSEIRAAQIQGKCVLRYHLNPEADNAAQTKKKPKKVSA